MRPLKSGSRRLLPAARAGAQQRRRRFASAAIMSIATSGRARPGEAVQAHQGARDRVQRCPGGAHLRSLAKKVLGSLKSILGEAVHREKLAVNPAAGIQIGTGGRHKKEVNIPSKADVKAILAKLDELAKDLKAWRRWRAILATAIYTGMRASEIRGLPWSSVDLKNGKISVTQRADENGVIGAVKSKSGKARHQHPSESDSESCGSGRWNARWRPRLRQRAMATPRACRTSSIVPGCRCRTQHLGRPSITFTACATSAPRC